MIFGKPGENLIETPLRLIPELYSVLSGILLYKLTLLKTVTDQPGILKAV